MQYASGICSRHLFPSFQRSYRFLRPIGPIGRITPTAVLPAAGSGSRFRPASRWVPKELMPLGGKPLLLHALEEAFTADIREAVVVSSPNKPAVREFCRDLDTLDTPVPADRVSVASQQVPYGLADALRVGRDAAGADNILSVLPDNVYLGEEPTPSQTLVSSFQERAHSLHYLHPVDASSLDDYGFSGLPRLESLKKNRFRILSLPSKQDSEPSPQDRVPLLRTCGRAIFTDAFFRVLEELESDLREQDRELDDVPVVQKMIEQDFQVVGVQGTGRVYDAGRPGGMATAWREWKGRIG